MPNAVKKKTANQSRPQLTEDMKHVRGPILEALDSKYLAPLHSRLFRRHAQLKNESRHRIKVLQTIGSTNTTHSSGEHTHDNHSVISRY